jgi:hypothetical protein
LGLRDLFARRVPEPRTEPRVEFLGEQDGPPEQALKAMLTADFAERPTVLRAYLARVGFQPGSPSGVALCLVSAKGADTDLVQRIGQRFAGLFASGVPLDILFLSGDQEADLQRVCRPFYVAAV